MMVRFGFAALVLVALTMFGCEEKLKPSVVMVTQEELPSQESWNSTVVFSDSARVQAILWAGHIAMYTTEQYTLLSDSVHIDFFNDLQQHSSTLTARRGRVNDRTQDLDAYERVRLVSDNGTILETEHLFWNNKDKTVRSDTFVEITSPTEHITGHGLVSDQSLKNYKIFRVTGRAVTTE
jgi:LPS export ABC transporter protein LptC